MSEEYNLSFKEAVNAAINGNIVVGEEFNERVVMTGNLSDEARLVEFHLETMRVVEDTPVTVNRKYIEMKYKIINSENFKLDFEYYYFKEQFVD